jgi:hypothetical protein
VALKVKYNEMLYSDVDGLVILDWASGSNNENLPIEVFLLNEKNEKISLNYAATAEIILNYPAGG